MAGRSQSTHCATTQNKEKQRNKNKKKRNKRTKTPIILHGPVAFEFIVSSRPSTISKLCCKGTTRFHKPHPNIHILEEEFKRARALPEETEQHTWPKNVQGRRRLEWPFKYDRTREFMRGIRETRETLGLFMQGEMQFFALLRVF